MPIGLTQHADLLQSEVYENIEVIVFDEFPPQLYRSVNRNMSELYRNYIQRKLSIIMEVNELTPIHGSISIKLI